MGSLLHYLTLLFCLVQVPHLTTAFARRTSLNKRFGSVPGSRREAPKDKLRFRNNGFLQPVVGQKFGSLVLECQVGGTSNPTIHWLKDGTRVAQGSRHNVFDEEAIYEYHIDGLMPGVSQTASKLYIDCLEDDDAGKYTCVAETPTTRKTQSTFVSVERGDKLMYPTLKNCEDGSSKKGVPARIYMWTDSRLEYEGTKIQLYCRAEGSPAPIISWYDDRNEPIENGGQYKIARNGDLIIDDIKWLVNMGGYTCIAENAFGYASTRAFVYPMSRGV